MGESAMLLLVLLWIVFAVSCTLFPLTYLFNPWHLTPEGRSIMGFAVAVAIMVDLTVLFHFVEVPHPYRYWAQIAALTYAIPAATYKLVVLWKEQIRAAKEAEDSVLLVVSDDLGLGE